MTIVDKDFDVAIVGCGVSGAYAGWRLLKSPSFPEPAKRFAGQRLEYLVKQSGVTAYFFCAQLFCRRIPVGR